MATTTTAKEHTGKLVDGAARFGYASKGLIYIVLGTLAAMAAWGAGGKTTDPHGAMAEIGDQPFGSFLMWAVGIGLLCYCAWRFIEAFGDTERRGTSAKGLLMRAGYVISGLVYGFLGWEAVAHQVHGESNSERSLAAKVMSWPGGNWLVAIIGLALVGYGLYQLVQSFTGRFMRQFDDARLSSIGVRMARYTGRLGLSARGLIFAVVGIFIVVAAVSTNPSKAKGIGEALDFVAQMPFGHVVLLTISLGLIAYGLYCLVRARYRSFKVDQLAA